jgi:hypothetical protein
MYFGGRGSSHITSVTSLYDDVREKLDNVTGIKIKKNVI